MGPAGKIRQPIVVILLSIVTLGIYGLFWTYRVFEDLKQHTGQGVGGVLGLILGFLAFVNIFLLPSEIGNMYAAEGQPKPVSGMSGFWVLIPLVGGFIWLFKVQGAMNNHWASHGVVAA